MRQEQRTTRSAFGAGLAIPSPRDNPILTAGDLPYPANTVFNAGATLLAERRDRPAHARRGPPRSLAPDRGPQPATASASWRIDPAPTLPADPEGHPEELWGIEDPRITWVEDQGLYFIAYTAYSPGGPLVSLATTKDFVTFTRLGPVMPPEDKDAASFPVRFDGRYAMLHRPSPTSTGRRPHLAVVLARPDALGRSPDRPSLRAGAAGGTPTRSASRLRRC